jgi:hypothetical protein
MRWGCVSRQGISAGGLGHMSLGLWNNGMIFADSLKSHWELGERCRTNADYLGSAPEFVKCPGGVWGESWKHEMQQRVRSRQDTVKE